MNDHERVKGENYCPTHLVAKETNICDALPCHFNVCDQFVGGVRRTKTRVLELTYHMQKKNLTFSQVSGGVNIRIHVGNVAIAIHDPSMLF